MVVVGSVEVVEELDGTDAVGRVVVVVVGVTCRCWGAAVTETVEVDVGATVVDVGSAGASVLGGVVLGSVVGPGAF